MKTSELKNTELRDKVVKESTLFLDDKGRFNVGFELKDSDIKRGLEKEIEYYTAEKNGVKVEVVYGRSENKDFPVFAIMLQTRGGESKFTSFSDQQAETIRTKAQSF